MRMDRERIVKIVCAAFAVTFFAAGLVYYAKGIAKRDKSEKLPDASSALNKNIPAKEAAVTVAVQSSAPEKTNFPIDINLVTKGQLTEINGIGDVLADKIITYRTQKGTIHDIMELTQVEGIGKELCEELKNYLFVAEGDYIEFTVSTKQTTAAPVTSTAVTSKSTAKTTKAAEFPIDINQVTYDELLQINGVGEHTANSILQLRNEKGRITDLEQLLEIEGIGKNKLKALAAYLYVAEGDYSKASTTTTSVTAATTKSTTAPKVTAKTTTKTSTTTAEPEKQMKRVNINLADAQEIADCLLIDLDMAQVIVDFREKIGQFSNTLELLYIGDYDKRFDDDFYRSIDDYVYIDEQE